MIVRGPMEMTTGFGFVCDTCGKEVEPGSPLFMGRAAGRTIHACRKKCFHLAVTKIGKEIGDVKIEKR